MITPEPGQIYYEVSFVDSSLKVPQVHPMRFIGINLFPDDEEPNTTSYYFEFPHDLSPGARDDGTSNKEYYCLPADGLHDLHTLAGAVAKLALVAAGTDLTKRWEEWVY